jgi:hypothetical protein
MLSSFGFDQRQQRSSMIQGAAKRGAVVTSIRIDPGVKAQLEEIAEADGRSRSGLIQKIVAGWLQGRRPPEALRGRWRRFAPRLVLAVNGGFAPV